MAIEMVNVPIENVGSFHTYISLPEKYIPSPLNHHSITINYHIENPLIFVIPQKNPQWPGWWFQPF